MKPIKKVKKEVKKKTKFFRNQSDTELRVKPSWRRPRGIDGRCRRKFRGCVPMPNIGYGTNKKHRHILPNGFIKFVVNNVSDLEMLIMHNRSYCAEVAHNVGAAAATTEAPAVIELSVDDESGVSVAPICLRTRRRHAHYLPRCELSPSKTREIARSAPRSRSGALAGTRGA